jgi:cation:H+ antiporter
MIQSFFGLIISLVVLIWSCEFAIKNSILVSKIFNIREIFVGIFIIAIGTSLPEFAATFQALQMGAEGIVAGNLVGSNIANILLVGGIMVFPLKTLNAVKQDQSTAIFFICFSILFFFLIFFDFTLGIKFSLLFILLLILFFYFELKKPTEEETLLKENNYQSTIIIISKIIIAFIILFFSSQFFIAYAKDLTELLGVAETTVGVTVVAFGTSIPEIVATIIAIIKKQNNLAVGNILGSNIANIFGITLIAIFMNGQINYYDLLTSIDKWIFLLSSIIFFIMIWKKMAGKLLSSALIFAYLSYFTYLYL